VEAYRLQLSREFMGKIVIKLGTDPA